VEQGREVGVRLEHIAETGGHCTECREGASFASDVVGDGTKQRLGNAPEKVSLVGDVPVVADGVAPLPTKTSPSYNTFETTAGTAGCMVATAADVARSGRSLLDGQALAATQWDEMRPYDTRGHYGLGRTGDNEPTWVRQRHLLRPRPRRIADRPEIPT
jgi:CubicO group peptidase (beta-lactamase class C family)